MAEQINLDEMRNNVNELLDSREFGRIRVLFTAMEPADIAELLGEIDEQRLLYYLEYSQKSWRLKPLLKWTATSRSF